MKPYVLIFILVLTGCRTGRVVEDGGRRMVARTRNDTVSDSIYLHDSIYVAERMRGDTLLLTRFQLRTQLRDRWRTHHDTLTTHDTLTFCPSPTTPAATDKRPVGIFITIGAVCAVVGLLVGWKGKEVMC